jgi:hypothetical protein
MLTILEYDQFALSFPTREYNQPSSIQTWWDIIQHYVREGMSLSVIIISILRVEGNLGIYPNVQLYQ